MNVSNTKPVTVSGGALPEDALESVAYHKHLSAVGASRKVNVATGVTSNLKYLASRMCDEMQARTSQTLDVADSDVEDYLKTLVQLRCLQVNKSVPKGFDLRDILVPDFFRPFLAYIGKYEDPLASVFILPVWCDFVPTAENNGENPLADCSLTEKPEELNTKPLVDFQQVYRMGIVLRRNGFRCSNGFPGELVTPSDAIFRICEGPDGSLSAAGSDIDEATLCIRGLIRIAYAREVFGAARTRYLSVEDLLPAMDGILGTGIS